MKNILKNHSVKTAILIVLIVACLFPVFSEVIAHPDRFFSSSYNTRYEDLKKLYYSSQYMIKKNPVIIPDETLEAFAGGAFLKGLNPILIVHDQPPLGRYITSLSILLFNNESTLTILLFLVSLLGIYLVAREVTKNNVISLLITAVYANEPLMRIKLIYTPLLELIQFPFIIFALYFFLRMIRGKNVIGWAVLTSLCLGGVISIRYFVLGGAILLAMMAFLIIKRRFKTLVIFFATLPLAIVVLIASYTRTVIDYQSIIKPLSVQKYIFAYHSSKFIQMGTVWDLLFFNRWHTWWGNRAISSDPNWILLWPLSALLTIFLIVGGLIKKIKIRDAELVIILWVVSYGLMLSVGFSSTRYFLPLIPFFYILACSLLMRLNYRRKTKRK